KPKLAITEYSIVQNFSRFTFIKVKLITGRTHQIRVHMSYLGNPVVGDLTYGRDKRIIEIHGKIFKPNNHLLHAALIDFKHPITNEVMSFQQKLPNEFQEILDFLQEKEYGRKVI
ncbi:MAG: pseudouridine synthase, partial [bacterium]|nr:pseudouridine synthase [bacterium]